MKIYMGERNRAKEDDKNCHSRLLSFVCIFREQTLLLIYYISLFFQLFCIQNRICIHRCKLRLHTHLQIALNFGPKWSDSFTCSSVDHFKWT